MINRVDPTPDTPFLRSDCDGTCKNDPDGLGHSHSHTHAAHRRSVVRRSVTPQEQRNSRPESQQSSLSHVADSLPRRRNTRLQSTPLRSTIVSATTTASTDHYTSHSLYPLEDESSRSESRSSTSEHNSTSFSVKHLSRVAEALSDPDSLVIQPERTNYTYAYSTLYQPMSGEVHKLPRLSRRGIHDGKYWYSPVKARQRWDWNLYQRAYEYWFGSVAGASQTVDIKTELATSVESSSASASGHHVSFSEHVTEFGHDLDSGLDSAASSDEAELIHSRSISSSSSRSQRQGSRSSMPIVSHLVTVIGLVLFTVLHGLVWPLTAVKRIWHTLYPYVRGAPSSMCSYAFTVITYPVCTLKKLYTSFMHWMYPDHYSTTNAYELRSRLVRKTLNETTRNGGLVNATNVADDELEVQPVVRSKRDQSAFWCCWWPLYILLALLLLCAALTYAYGTDGVEKAYNEKLVPFVAGAWASTRDSVSHYYVVVVDGSRSSWLWLADRSSHLAGSASVLYVDKLAAARHNVDWFCGGIWSGVADRSRAVTESIMSIQIPSVSSVTAYLPAFTLFSSSSRMIDSTVGSGSGVSKADTARIESLLADIQRRLVALEAVDHSQYVTYAQLEKVLEQRLVIINHINSKLIHVQESVAAASSQSLTLTDSLVADLKSNKDSLAALTSTIGDLQSNHAALSASIAALSVSSQTAKPTKTDDGSGVQLDAATLALLQSVPVIQQKLSQLEAHINTVSLNVDMSAKAGAANRDNDKQAAAIQGSMNKLTGDLESLSALVANLQSSVKQLEGDNTATSASLAALSASLTAYSATAGSGASSSKVDTASIRAMIAAAISVYDADKTGMPDHALESSGGSVLSTRCSETYNSQTRKESIYNIPLWYVNMSPRITIQRKTHSLQPGDCWAVKGATAYLVLQLSGYVNVSHITYEHIPISLAPDANLESAPREFELWALKDEHDMEGHLLGAFEFDDHGLPVQMFPVQDPNFGPVKVVEIKVRSNHGHPIYTCMYRWRIHGKRILPAYGRVTPNGN